MKNRSTTLNVPDCVLDYLRKSDFEDHHYHLYGSARAIGWIRMAVKAIRSTTDQTVAVYHAYAGISAARTAIDAVASWLNVWLSLSTRPPTLVDLAKDRFLEKVQQHLDSKGDLSMLSHFKALGELARTEIDPYRQRVQHREGLALVLYSTGVWYIAPNGLQFPRAQDQKLAELLEDWVYQIENHLCDVVEAIK